MLKKSINIHNYAIKGSFILFTFLILLIIFSMAVNTRQSKLEELNESLNKKTKLISKEINDYFSYIWRVSEDKGRKIIDSKNITDETIQFHLKRKFSYMSSSTEFSHNFLWPRFYWLNHNNQITVNSYSGIYDNPEGVNLKPYQFFAQKNSWQLQFSEPFIDPKTSDKIIFGAMGVKNKNKEIVGSILIKFEIKKIIERINSLIQKNGNYIILNGNLNIALSSNKIDQDTFFEANEVESFFKNNKQSGILKLKKPFIYDDIKYNTATRLQNFPFIILTGYNTKAFISGLYSSILSIIILVFTSSFFIIAPIILLLRHNKRNIIRLNQFMKQLIAGNFDKKIRPKGYKITQEIFLLEKQILRMKSKLQSKVNTNDKLKTENSALKSINKTLLAQKKEIFKSIKLKNRFDLKLYNSIHNSSKILKNYVTDLVHIELNNNPKNTILMIYNKMLDEIDNVEDLSTDKLNIKKQSIIPIIHNAVLNNTLSSIEYNIKISLNFSKNIKSLMVDEFRFFQIINALILRSFSDSPRSKININVTNKTLENKLFLKILITDDGFGISEEEKLELASIANTGINKIKNKIGLYDMSFSDVEKLIILHHGTITITSKYNHGSTVSILLPYKREESKNTKNIIKADNLVNFQDILKKKK